MILGLATMEALLMTQGQQTNIEIITKASDLNKNDLTRVKM